MKPYLCFLSGLSILLTSGCVGSSTLSAQPPVTVIHPPQNGPQTPLEELLAPIALYPDALIALILPASTASSDVVLAARYLNANGDPAQVASQPWDESVKGLAHYPEVVKWMDENLSWTQRVGEEYSAHPDQAMAAVQQARLRAREKGILVDNPQQQVVVEREVIRIVPAQPDIIYVPRYDPEIIYVDQPVYYESNPWITFGIGFGVGAWLNHDCDWHRHVIWVDDRRWERRCEVDWRRPYYPREDDYADHRYECHEWRREGRGRPMYHHSDYGDHAYAQPTHLAGTPHFDHDRNVGGSPDRWRHRSELPDRAMQPAQVTHSVPAVAANPAARGVAPNTGRSNAPAEIGTPQVATPVVQSRPAVSGGRLRQPLPWNPTQPIVNAGSGSRHDPRAEGRPAARSESLPAASHFSSLPPAPGVTVPSPASPSRRISIPVVARQAEEPRRFHVPERAAAPAVQQTVQATPVVRHEQPVAHVQPAPQSAPDRSDHVVRSERPNTNKDSDHNHREREQNR